MMKFKFAILSLLVWLLLSPSNLLAKQYALLVGVNKYKKSELNNLKFSENDVTEISKTLLDNGYEPRNVVLMTQSRASKGDDFWKFYPTLANIETQLNLLLANRKPDDTVIVALAGHGLQFEDDGEHYFCPMDTKVADRSTLLSIAEVFKKLENCNASGKVLLVDACRNDPLANSARSASFNLGDISNRLNVDSLGGTVAFFSCSAAQKSYEDEELGGGHGVFLFHVNEALSGGFKGHEEGEDITFSDLKAHAYSATEEYVRTEFEERQNPAFRSPKDTRQIVLIKGNGPPKRIINNLKMRLNYIPPGKFSMGSSQNLSDSDQPHNVSITKAFYMGTTEVTQAQWFAVMETRPWEEFKKEKESYPVKVPDMFVPDPQRPAVYVSWEDAMQFCETLSEMEKDEDRKYRLPTEAEWEYACRGGSIDEYCFGDDETELEKYGWYKQVAAPLVAAMPVAEKDHNDFGIYDMHGNVMEWCNDWYGDYPRSSCRDPQGPAKGRKRVLRGGNCFRFPSDCRSAARSCTLPDQEDAGYGFRVVLEMKSGK